MNNKIVISGAILGMLAVIFGAFGAHALKEALSENAIDTFETGVRYQMYHALLLLIIGTTNLVSIKFKKRIFWCLILGILFFSGSIYLLSIDELLNFNAKSIGIITPIGGLLLIIGWFLLITDFITKRTK